MFLHSVVHLEVAQPIQPSTGHYIYFLCIMQFLTHPFRSRCCTLVAQMNTDGLTLFLLNFCQIKSEYILALIYFFSADYDYYFNYNFNNVKYLIEYLIRVSDINMHNRKCVKPLPVNTLLLLLKGTSYLPCKAMAHSHKSQCGPHCHFETAQLVS